MAFILTMFEAYAKAKKAGKSKKHKKGESMTLAAVPTENRKLGTRKQDL
jgi:hypothetical protein